MLCEDAKAWHSKLCDMTGLEIVKLMEDEGIKGTPGDNRRCAIAELIKLKTGQQVVVGLGGMMSVLENGMTDFSGVFVTNSEPVRRFISGFDKGFYPQLVRHD